MALLITDEEAKNKLEHKTNLLIKHKLVGRGGQQSNGGRPKGIPNWSPEVKAIIGTLANQSTNKEVAEAFGMSASQVGAYSRGLDSAGHKPDEVLRKHLEANVEEVRSKVIGKILKSIDAINDEKITEANFATLSKAASNLAGVFDRLGPKDTSSSGLTQNQFVFFGVKPRTENDYQVIEVEAAVNQ
jgi:transposase-like protein